MIKAFMAIILATLSFAVYAKVSEVPLDEIKASEKHRSASIIVTQVMKRYHYLKNEIDNSTSALMLDRYIESLDPNRRFFTLSDVQSFDQYRFKLDEALQRGKPDPAFIIFKVFRERVESRMDYAIKLLNQSFDFTINENYLFDRENAPWSDSEAALDDLWRKRVKNDVLTLRLAGKDEKDISDTLKKRYEGVSRRTKQLQSDDVFQMFLNAYTLVVEPHTGFMSVRASENFDINMRLSLEGIGAVLTSENEFTKVERIIVGGPAEKSGQIKSGDLITGVAQDIDGEMLDIVGWSLSDVVSKIRGAKGSIVRLSIIGKNSGKNAPAREIIIIRDQIKLEDQAVKSQVIENVGGLSGLRIGVIEVPAFYRDFEGQINGDTNFRSTTRDVKKLLTELKDQNVVGIVIDLRDNGGGSLTEATELTGLFIGEGPVVQVRESNGDIKVEVDDDPAIYYSGPLAVLVNRNSASASEIFAGAIKDYHRGVVIGEPTFGKGTVQTLIDLAKMIRSDDKLGRLRLTMAQFFRVNGGSTQHKGVVPDIVFPTAKWVVDHGERSLEHALPWGSIDAVDHELGELPSFSTSAQLINDHQKRIKSDPGFKFLEEQEKLFEAIRDEKIVSLNEVERQKSHDQREVQRLAARNRFRESRGFELLKKDTSDDDKDKFDEEDDEALKLVMLNESARILSDYITENKMTVTRSAILN